MTRSTAAKTDEGVEFRFAMGPKRARVRVDGRIGWASESFAARSWNASMGFSSPARVTACTGSIACAMCFRYGEWDGDSAGSVVDRISVLLRAYCERDSGAARERSGRREVKGTELDLLTPDRLPKQATALPCGSCSDMGCTGGVGAAHE